MIRGIDHVVLLVAELEGTIRGFQQVGFNVVRGGIHPAWGTENALIPFADGFYLELLAPREPSVAARHRLWLRPDGGSRKPGEYGGFALESDDLQADVRAAAAHGLEFTPPAVGERRRPDGTEVQWVLSSSVRPDLPFLIEDLTPRSTRVPAPVGPLNGRTRLAAVTVAVPNLAEASQAYAALLERAAGHVGLDGTTYQTSRGHIVLLEQEHPPGKYPDPGLVAVRLATAGGSTHALAGATGGAVLNLVPDGGDA